MYMVAHVINIFSRATGDDSHISDIIFAL